MSIQYRKHDYFYFQKDKKKYFQNTEKHPKPNWFKIKKKKKPAVMPIKFVRIRKAST